jgi:sarcosine oxidase subunit alpha
MLREDGFVMDDGTVSRLAEHRFLLTTTTANAARVMQHLELCHQWLWPQLELHLVSVSEQWAQCSVAGPRSRDLLRRLVDPQHDISDAALPYMGVATPTILGGLPARLFRISFSGELAYEIAVPAGFGDLLVRRLMDAGRGLGVTPYGTEALGVMRIEKGHVAGNEINGHTTAADLGLGRMMSTRKDYVGRALSQRPALREPGRPTLVGLKPLDRSQRLRAGAHLLGEGRAPGAAGDEGYVTSVAFSPTLGHWIALALLAHGPQRHGQSIEVHDPLRDSRIDSRINSRILAEVCDPVFLDPSGERLRG